MIPLSLPMITEHDIAALRDVLQSGWLTTGPRVAAFEQALESLLGFPCVAVSSATAGLHLALKANGIGEGHRVIVPTWTFTATAHAVELAGATPVFCDVDPVTLNMTPHTVVNADAAGATCKAVIPVHMAGRGCDLEGIAAAMDGAECVIIEDAAHAFLGNDGAGKMIPSGISECAVFSFYATKGLTTLGEGGLVACCEPELAQAVRNMRFHGVDREAWDRNATGGAGGLVVIEGFKYNMSDAQAAMGLSQLQFAAEWMLIRTQLARQYAVMLADLPIQLPAFTTGHAWHLYQIKLPTVAGSVAKHHERLFQAAHFVGFMREKGIACGMQYTPLHRHPYWANKYELDAKDFPFAESCHNRVVSLPMWAGLTAEQQIRVVEAVRSYFRGN